MMKRENTKKLQEVKEKKKQRRKEENPCFPLPPQQRKSQEKKPYENEEKERKRTRENFEQKKREQLIITYFGFRSKPSSPLLSMLTIPRPLLLFLPIIFSTVWRPSLCGIANTKESILLLAFILWKTFRVKLLTTNTSFSMKCLLLVNVFGHLQRPCLMGESFVPSSMRPFERMMSQGWHDWVRTQDYHTES